MLSAIKHGLDGLAAAIGVDDSMFRPITLDVGEPVKGGCVKITLATVKGA
jgi:crossover junction endodeoxyribonuclease RusA